MVRAIDGDTIKVLISDKYESVRLIGVNAPELKDERRQVRCFAEAAKAKADFRLDYVLDCVFHSSYENNNDSHAAAGID